MRRALPYFLAAVLLGFAFFPRPGRSAENDTWLDVSGLSYHFRREHKHNEVNTGIGIEHQATNDWALTAGMYKNSFWRQSYYVGGVYTPWHLGTADAVRANLGGALWIVTGYDKNPVPIPFGVLMLEHKDVGVNIGLAPSVIMLQVKFKLY